MQPLFLEPMFDRRLMVLGLDVAYVPLGLAGAGLIVGFVLIHRATGGEPDARSFRATDPPRRGRLAALRRTLHALLRTPDAVRGNRTPGWYLTRIELALGIGVFLLATLSVVYDPTFSHPMMEPRPFGPADLVIPAGFLGMLLGLAWMIRIFRGPRDEPPSWRYRDR